LFGIRKNFQFERIKSLKLMYNINTLFTKKNWEYFQFWESLPVTLKIFFYRLISIKNLYTSFSFKSPLQVTTSLGSQSVSRSATGSSSYSSGSIFPQSITQNSPTVEMPHWTKTAHPIPKNIAYLWYPSKTKKNNPEINVGKSTKFSKELTV
jgi:hypothetical protein